MSGRIWLCNSCGKRGPWTDDWSWYGSILEQESGDELPTFCSERCQPGASDLANIRRRIRKDPNFVLAPIPAAQITP